MDIEELRTFVDVADAGGVTPASRRLGLSKSIVSRRLAKLEDDLGVQLLSRTQLAFGALVPIMKECPVRTAGMFVVRPPGQRSDRKVRTLTEMLIECFDQSPAVAARRSKVPTTIQSSEMA